MLGSAILSALISSALVGAQNINIPSIPNLPNLSQVLPSINTTEICGNFSSYCTNSSIPNPLANICGASAAGVSPPVTASCVLPNGTDISKTILSYMNISVPLPSNIQNPLENITVPNIIPNGVPLPKADPSISKRDSNTGNPNNQTIVAPNSAPAPNNATQQQQPPQPAEPDADDKRNTTDCSASITSILDLAPNYGKMITITVPANGTAVTKWSVKTVAPSNTNVTSTIGATSTQIRPFNRRNIEFITLRGNGTDGAIAPGSVKVVQVFFSTNGNATKVFSPDSRVVCETD